MAKTLKINAMTLDEFERRLSGSDRVVYDSETEGLDWRHHKICGHVFNFGPRQEDGIYLPVRHKGGANHEPKKILTIIKKSVKKNPRVLVQFFNGHFDLKFLAAEGLDISEFETPFEDGQINAFLLNELQRKMSLDECCKVMGVQEKKGDALYEHLAKLFGGKPDRDQMANFHKTAGDDPIAVDYALGDGVSTWQLIDAQQPKLDEQDLRNIWMIERRCIKVLARMSIRGVKIDEDRLRQVMHLVQKKADRLREKLPKDFNPRAPTQMVKLMRDNGVEGWPETGKGNPSFTKEWLVQSEIGRAVVGVREMDHLMNSFMTPMLERHLYKGRVHTTYNQTRGEDFGTVTGRLSSNDPNLQQVHKRNVLLGSVFRSVFVPDEGKLMASADYEQIEPRLLAHYADIKLLLDGYLATPPVDSHSSVAIKAFGYDPKDKSPENKRKRDQGKTLNQALITGSGDRAAIAQLGVSYEQGMRIVRDYFAAMPELKPAQRRISNVFISRGFLTSLHGRRARLDDTRFAYRGLNRLLQCGNADVIKVAMCDIDEYFYAETDDEVNLLNNIHDDLQYQYHPDHEKYFRHAIDLMQQWGPTPDKTHFLEVPLSVEHKSGRNWAESSYDIETIQKMFKEMGGEYR